MIDVLVVDDDPGICNLIKNLLESEGIKTETVPRGEDALKIVEKVVPRLVLLDIRLPDMDGISLMNRMKEKINAPFILFTAFGTIEEAVKAIKEGASDYIEKPIEPTLFLKKIKNYLELSHLKTQLPSGIVKGKSRAMQRLWERVEKIASVDVPVLILGETGSGKEVVAREIHRLSRRKDNKFLPVHTAAIPENLLESELFGFKKGAFSGAVRDKKGLVQIADRGTLFLDEIGDIPVNFQVKLLRFIEEKRFIPVGGVEEVNVDVRIIGATNRDIETLVERGDFREDLYYRIRRFVIEIPPLRKRKEDIPVFVEHFIQQFNREFNKNIRGIEPEGLEILMSHSWPGNIRELKAVIEEAVLYAEGWIKKEHINLSVQPSSLRKELRSVEKEHLVNALRKFQGNISKTAEFLGIQRKQVYRLIKRYHINIDDFRR